VDLAELLFQGMQCLQLLVPAPLQIGSNEPIFRVHGVVLTARPCGLEARLFDRVLELLDLVQFLSPQIPHRGQRSFDSERLYSVKHLTRDRAINPHPAEADATHFRPFAESPATGIAL
jgi:hypothetical protein